MGEEDNLKASHVYYRHGDLILELIVREDTGSKIEVLRTNKRDSKRYAKILKYLKDKYGFNPTIDNKEMLGLDGEFLGY
jgi:hypothetical protein